MSGGYFDYAFCKVHDFSSKLMEEIINNKVEDEYGHKYNFSEETIMELTKIARQAEQFARLMREVEWLYSADTGEDTFVERIKEIRR